MSYAKLRSNYELICQFMWFSLLLLFSSGCAALSLPVPLPNAGVVTQRAPITVVPTPSTPKLVTVTGYLLLDGSPVRPVGDAILYLGPLVKSVDGKPGLAKLDRTSPLRTLTDSNGRFVFVDVPADRYALILDRITSSYLLNDPRNNTDMIVDLQPGTIYDVGRLVYSKLPD